MITHNYNSKSTRHLLLTHSQYHTIYNEVVPTLIIIFVFDQRIFGLSWYYVCRIKKNDVGSISPDELKSFEVVKVVCPK